MPKDIDEFQQETKDAAVEEVVHKIENDPDFAETVAGALVEHEGTRAKLMSDKRVAAKMTEHLLKGDANLVDKVRGELEAEGFRIESGQKSDEYTDKDARRDFDVAAATAMEHKDGNDTDPVKIAKANDLDDSAFVTKTTEETNFTQAGVTIPTPLSNTVVEVLDSEPAFMRAGPRVMPMPQGKIDITRQSARTSANWQGESTTVSKSDPTFELLQLTSHKLTVGVDISNDFFRREGMVGQSFFFDDMSQAAENKLDSTLLEGGGGNNEPEGLTTQLDSAHSDASSGNTISNIADDLKKKKRQLEGADVPTNNRVWFMRPEVQTDLAYDINSNEDTFPYREEVVDNGTLFSYPIFTTTNINLDGSNKSNIYLVEMSEVFVGRGTDFELTASAHEKFSDDITVLKLISHWDMQLAHAKAAGEITSYTLQ